MNNNTKKFTKLSKSKTLAQELTEAIEALGVDDAAYGVKEAAKK